MTRQETFDIVTKHLLTQNAVSEDEGGTCMYRGPNGLKCAVGVLIPDELHCPSMEGEPADGWMVADILRPLGHDVELCADLQRIHDIGYTDDWHEALADLACEHGLTFNPPAVTP